jgi:hypothetical protein
MLVPKAAVWVASAVARRVELWDDAVVLPPALAARAAVLAFGDELLDLVLPRDYGFIWRLRWRSPGGRKFAAAYLLPRAEAALRQELQRLADAAKSQQQQQQQQPSQQQQQQQQQQPPPQQQLEGAAAAAAAF